MKKLISSILFTFLGQFILCAQSIQNIESKISSEHVFIENDTLLIINFHKAIKSEFYESEIQASYLLRKKQGKIDTLLIEIPKNPEFEISQDFIEPLKFNLNEMIYEQVKVEKVKNLI